MVTEWFLNWATTVIAWVVDLLPDWAVPPEIMATGGLMQTILSNAAGLGVWVDWAGIIGLALIPPGVWVIGVLWKAGRTAFSHFPGIGGSG